MLLEYVAAVVPWVWDVWDQDTGEVPTGSTGVRSTGRPSGGALATNMLVAFNN